jgi:hypothetical protein
VADAQFIINVAASFEGEQTLETTDALSSKLAAAGATASDFQRAVLSLSRSIDTAAAASTAANAALAAGNAEYKLLEQSANEAAKAVEKAAAGSKGVVDLGAYRAAVAASKQATSALQDHAGTLAKLEQAAKQATAEEKGLSTSLENTRKLAKAAADAENTHERSLKKTAGALNGVGGPLGKLGGAVLNLQDDFGDMSETLGSSGASAVVAASAFASVALVVAVVTAAVIAGVTALAAWAIGLADARRSAGLTQQAVEALDPSIAALSGSFASITAQTGQTTPQLDALARSLEDAKVKAADMPEALRAAALAEAALGQGGSAKFLADIKAGKVAVSALSAEANSKLGGIVKKQMLGLTAQTATLKANIGQLFGGLNIDPVLSGLQKLVALFDENTAAGSAIKFLFESIFQPLINQADKAATVIEAFVLGFLIGLTKLYIAVKPAIKAVSEFLGLNAPDLSDTLAAVTKAGEYLVPAFVVAAAIFAAFAVAIGVTVAAVVGIQVAIYSMVAAVVYAGVAVVQGIQGAWQAVTAYLDGIIPGLGQVGTQIMQGLANGIAAAAGLPLQAITGAVSGAISGAKSLLGIHSPSKVFADIGGYTAEGFAQGVDEGAPEAQTSLASMVSPSSAQDALSGNVGGSAPASGGASSGGGVVINLQGAQLTFQGVKDGPDSIERFGEMLTDYLEQDAAAAGGASAA